MEVVMHPDPLLILKSLFIKNTESLPIGITVVMICRNIKVCIGVLRRFDTNQSPAIRQTCKEEKKKDTKRKKNSLTKKQ